MKWKYVFIILILAVIISLINPARYYFADKEISKLPKYVSYEQAIFDSLPNLIQKQATKYNCRKYIIPVNSVSGFPASLSSLKEDVNLALASYTGWKLSVDNKIRKEMMSRMEENIRKWGDMMSGQEMFKILSVQQNASLQTRYQAKAKLSRIDNLGGNDLQLLLSVYKTADMSKLFDIRLIFAHPQTVQKWEKDIAVEKSELAELARKSRIGLYAAAIFAGLIILSVIMSLILSYITKRRRDFQIAEINNQIEMREELIDNGHYVAALELADKYLAFFPNDIEIKAFRERLLDFTNDNPKKAQIAFVEAKKLQTRLQNPQSGMYLTDSDKEELSNLLPYHPQLKENFSKLIAYEDEDKKRSEFQEKFNTVLDLFNKKMISAADTELKKIESIYHDQEEIKKLREEIDGILSYSAIELDSIKKQIFNDDLNKSLKRLSKLLKDHKDYLLALELQKTVKGCRVKNGFRLLSMEMGLTIDVLCKQEVIIGRPDEDLVMDIKIEDKHVSRPHLKLRLDDEKLTLEDLNSTGGTYLNGEKIDKCTLKKKEIITLAKIVDLEISIHDDKGKIGGVLISHPEGQYIVLNSEIAFQFKQNRLDLRKANYRLIIKNRLPLFISSEGSKILIDKASVILAGIEFVIVYL